MDMIDRVIAREGGAKVTNDPNDPGGLTKYGISSRAHPNVDVANLTYDQAKDIYINEYYLHYHIQLLPEVLQEHVLDFCVHSDGEAIKQLQILLGIEVDGIVGVHTIKKLGQITNMDYFIDAYKRSRCLFLAKQVVANPKKLKYLVGWLNRVLSI